MSEGETGGPSIRIFLSYHKNSARVKSSILTPIHVGRAIASDSVKSELSDIIGDDTDDNISELNPSFCELTAQYWAWKNTNYDYTGFFHYRRHLIFSDDNFKEDIYGLVNYPYVTSDYLKKAGLDDRTIESKIKGYDLIVAERWNVTNAGSKDNYDHYKSSSPYLHISDYDKMIEILLKRYPDYAEDVEAYNRSKYGYYTNMFIMKRPLFEDYCNFLFSILFELSRKVDISGYNVQEKRIFGYLSEWMLGIYVFHYLRVVKRPVLELKRAFIRYPDVESGYLNICSSCDNNYARHLGVFLVSIKANKGDEKIHYWVFSDGISDYNRKKIASLGSDDFKITILNAEKNSIPGLESTLATNPHLSPSAYNKLFLPDYVPMNIEVLLYLDADMICRGSLAELFSTDFEGNYVCGVKDILCKENCKRLHLSMYINSGLLLMNCSAWRSEGISDLFRDYITKNIHNRNAIFYQDQDVVNKVLAGHILYIDNKWNAQTSSFSGSAEQNEIGKTAVIIHFISSRKPWMKNSGNPFESEYTKYFEISPWSREPRYLKSADRPRKKNPVSKSFSRFSNAVLDEYGLNFFTERMLRFDILIGNPKDLNRYFDKSYGNDERVKDAFDLTLEYAKKGNPHAMVRVARAYKDGRGVQKDCRESFKWYSGVISQGKTWCYPEYESVLPGFYDESYKTKDPQYWSDLFNALIPLAEDGNPDAAVRIARAYKDAHGVGRDLKQSFYWFRKTQDTGVKWVKGEFGKVLPRMYDESYKTKDPQYWSDLFNALLTYAEDGNPHAMVRIARAYKDAHGVGRDLKQSFYWFKRTCDTGVDWVAGEFSRNLPEMYDDSYRTDDPKYWSDLFN
jgi:lipopolysaccharide biosynthesis glycosyltransferase